MQMAHASASVARWWVVCVLAEERHLDWALAGMTLEVPGMRCTCCNIDAQVVGEGFHRRSRVRIRFVLEKEGRAEASLSPALRPVNYLSGSSTWVAGQSS